MLGLGLSRQTVRFLIVGLGISALGPTAAHAQSLSYSLTVPTGFSAEPFAEGLDEPWGLAFGPDGRLYVSLRAAGRLARLTDSDGDGWAEDTVTILDGLDAPSGIAFRGDELWVVEARRVSRVDGVVDNDFATGLRVVVDDLPEGGTLASPILFASSGDAFFVAVATTCDACNVDDPRSATIVRYTVDGSEARVWARGLRHAAGMARNPLTGEVWATDVGRGGLAADVPTDELNALHPGGHYGWPYCFGVRVPAPEFADPQRCDRSEEPAFQFPAGSSPAGIVFYSGDSFPADYSGSALVVLQRPASAAGSVVARLIVTAGRPVALERFVSGWPNGLDSEGLPVGLAVGPDGSLYVSDGPGGRVWRVSYSGADTVDSAR
jgi:glucose/arabinose dehydrogenase